MEAVKTFNSELYSLNDYKPPISKAKMTQITKSAIKALKFYKHVVQSVEKFIQKCKPEYKVPGLYVIDSIVRQSRHQFGHDKDVFAPRFSNNIINTFQNLYRCPADEKSKIVRVLNLWQKNNVFKSEIIQPLLDMAAGIPPPVVTPNLPSTAAAVSNTPGTPATPVTPANIVQGIPDPWIAQIASTDTLAAVAQILQSPQGQQLQHLVQSLHVQQQKPQPSLLQALDAGLVVQLQALTAQLTAAASSSNTLNPLEQSMSLSKKLMDRFDFGDDSSQPEESNKDTQQIQLVTPPRVSESMNNSLFHQLAEHLQQQNLEHLRQQFMEQHTPKMPAKENQDMSESENSATPSQDDSQQTFLDQESQIHASMNMQQEDMDIEEMQDVTEEMFEKEEKKIMKDERPRTRSKSRSRSPRKRRSRSRSGSRKRKHRKRSRSRSRERKRKTSRSYSSERRAREREKERQKKGLPPIRSKTLSVCSTTLWVGQVDKKATQQDLTNVFEEFGQIESINMIPPRGCAYVCMVHRQDAFRALQKLSAGSCKIGSKIIKIAWALNKGVKQEYKQFWDVDLGVTYIPWEKLKLDDLDDFAEGGMIDQETVNNDWETQKNPEPSTVKEPAPNPTVTTTATVQSSTIPKNTVITTQQEAYSQPVAMLQIPVAATVPAVSLVPPAFPVSMSVPPPGFSAIPPPPFLRTGFNPSQPPPGFIPPPVPPPAIPPPPPTISSAITTALVHQRIPIPPDAMKEVSYGSMMLPVSSVVTTQTTPAVSTPSIFNPVSSNQGEQDEKRSFPGETQVPESTSTNHSQSTVVSSTGILGVQHPSPVTAHIPHLNIHGRVPSMPFLDIRPGILQQPPTARFAMLQPGLPPPPPPRSILPPTLIDPSVHPLPFPPGDIFTHPERPYGVQGRPGTDAVNIQEKNIPVPNDHIRQDGDQDYRFPRIEKHENPGQTSTGEHGSGRMPAGGSQDNQGVNSAEQSDVGHKGDNHELQDMAVVDPCEGQEKLIADSLGHMSPDESLESERKHEMDTLDKSRAPGLHAYDIGTNSSDSHDSQLRPPVDIRPQFGGPPVDMLPPFGRHLFEGREFFGRPPLEGRDHFGRPPIDVRDHFVRPPMESRDHYGRPPLEDRSHFGRPPIDGREHFGRPPQDIRDDHGRQPPDVGSRREHFNFPPDKPWGHRGDFDERQHHFFPGFGGPKGFHDERFRHGNHRPELRNVPNWNRGFEQDGHRDFDDRRRPWDRQRDRDDRDFGFRREVNGNRFGRERPPNWVPPQPHVFEYFPEATSVPQKDDSAPQVNGESPENSSEQQTVKKSIDTELSEKQESPVKVNKEKDVKEPEIECQPVVESTETEGT
ncbi:SCAF8 isoform X1 [Pelobates cultripes]|uniref:SCAF8 isoform X1 n=1 Tax=Pelobates cultripes TaxID=61616 RepID=A0AAD1RFC6_PELCU|nr:SCAF8 isoform X1 [Pelobates cultripes]